MPILSGVTDDGAAIHYSAVPRGAPVYASDGTQVGVVHQVVDNYREHILDGVVIETEGGDLRFVDAPEVGRTAERGVTLTIDRAAVETLPPPESGAGTFSANMRTGRLGKLLGRAWKRD
jgi:sporulation protein YlmC with PRC-barrel domain